MSIRKFPSHGPHTRGSLGEGHLIITPFPTNSLTSMEFGWMHAETWDDGDRAFFLANRQTLVANFYRTPPLQFRQDRSRGAAVGRWILRAGEARLSSAVAHLFDNKFRRLEIMLGEHPDPEQESDHVAFLLSGLILVSQCDQAIVVPPAGVHLNGFTEPRRVLALAADESCHYHQIYPMDPEQWWAEEKGAALRETFRYLERRGRRLEAIREAQKKPRSRRGFFSRWLFRS